MLRGVYEVLGVNPNSSLADCKKAYRSLSRKYHPDSSSGDAAKFLEIKEAWEQISSGTVVNVIRIKKRKVYHESLYTYRTA